VRKRRRPRRRAKKARATRRSSRMYMAGGAAGVQGKYTADLKSLE
jgi:hypothetical protein